MGEIEYLDDVRVGPDQGIGGSTHGLDAKYRTWITQYQANNNTHHACGYASAEMKKAFPELCLVRGHVHWDVNWAGHKPIQGGMEHWWCEDKDGLIYDPTQNQWDQVSVGCSPVYIWEPVDESQAHTFPTGKCPDCGDYTYRGEDFCSDDCANSYHRYIQSEVGRYRN